MRNSFIFYRTVYDSVKDIPMEIRDEVLMALMEFGLNGKEVPIKNPVAKVVFNLLKGPIEVAFKKYENAIKGGAPKGNSNNRYSKKHNNQTTTKEQPKNNLTTTETQAENNQETTEVQSNNKIIREYDNSLNITPPISPSGGESVSETEKEFERFWEMYDKKTNKVKVRAKFLKLSKADKEKIFATLQAYVDNTPDKTYRKDPLTYLNNQSWNDEIIPRNETRQSTASRPSDDHSQYRDYRRSYPTISDI